MSERGNEARFQLIFSSLRKCTRNYYRICNPEREKKSKIIIVTRRRIQRLTLISVKKNMGKIKQDVKMN